MQLWLRTLVLALGWAGAALAGCPEALRQVLVEHLLGTQHGWRNPESELTRLQTFVEGTGRFPLPLSVNEFEDGALYVRDGHHSLEVAKRMGLQSLEEGLDVQLERLTYAQYGRINFAQGWITPFDPRTTLRLAQLGGYRKLIEALRTSAWGDAGTRAFIHAHPEAYSIRKSELDSAPTAAAAGFEGSLRDRESYFIKMDASMPMKVGHLLPVFPSRGTLYEPGAGSGMQSAAYAAYNPHLLVVSGDLDRKAVRHAQERFRLPNLVQIQADAQEPVFPPGFLDAVVDSSLGHHITSYGNPKHQEGRIEAYRRRLLTLLKPGGRYGMRDFVAPDWPAEVELEVPTAARNGTPPYGQLSVAQLLESFCAEFRSHDYPATVPLQKLPSTRAGFARYRLPGEAAANFLLRVEYTAPESWPAELNEQYTYYSREEHVLSMQRLGFRVDYAANVRNPWIESRWWLGQGIRVAETSGGALDFPPTNFLLYATKARKGDTIALSVTDAPASFSARALKLESYRDTVANTVTDIIRVPGITHAYIPFEKSDDTLFIYLLPTAEHAGLPLYSRESALAEAYYSGVGPGALGGVVPAGTSALEGFRQQLKQKAHAYLDPGSESKIQIEQASVYLSSPGGSDELVTEHWVNMHGAGENAVFRFGDAKRVELKQLLSAAHVGAVPEPRLELAAYRLALAHKLPMLQWFGEALPHEPQTVARSLPTAPSLQALGVGDTIAITPVSRSSESPPSFMQLLPVRVERSVAGATSEVRQEEFMLPRRMSVETFSVLPYFIDSNARAWVGLEKRRLVAAQLRGKGGVQAVAPAWRLEKGLNNRMESREYLRRRMAADFNLCGGKLVQLGEGYFPSIGNSPEKVTPFAYAVDMAAPPQGLTFVPLATLLANVDRVADLHTQLAVFRLAHALDGYR